MNPLPQLIFDRLKHANDRVQNRIWASSADLAVLAGPVTELPVDLKEAKRQTFTPIKPGTFFKAKGGTGWSGRWFRIRIPAPVASERGRRFLRWDCHGEATVWLDGEPWCGLDVGHHTCPLPDRACDLWISAGLWQTGIWVPGAEAIPRYGCRFDGASLKVRDLDAWALSFDLACLVDVVDRLLRTDGVTPPWIGYHPELADVGPLLRRMLGAVDRALDSFRDEEIPALAKALRKVYAQFPAESWQPAADLVGHAHIDLVWLWPEHVTEAKGLHTFATMLRLMERYPEFIYTQTQPALYRAIERRAPALARQIKARIKQGRWEAQGAFEVEPDNQLPCGEALVRSVFLAQKKFTDLTGRPARTCWIPDVFGYSACLPQILAQSGVDRFYTTKMTWSAVNRFPYTSFIWRGHDGSDVLTHLCAVGYNGDVRHADLVDPLRKHRDLDAHPAMLLPTGFGDGGGGTTEEQIERARRYANLAATPRASWTTVDTFFDRLDAVRKTLPVYQGELYLEYHRGTYTTQSQFKAAHRELERALQTHEAIRVATGGGTLDPAAWLRLAFAQFHDAIPGSSIGLVYAQLTPELRRHTADQLAAAQSELAGSKKSDKDSIAIVNPLAWPVDRAVSIKGTLRGLTRPDGEAVATQVVGQGRSAVTLARVQLPPLGGVYLKQIQAAKMADLIAAPDRLASDRLEARFDRAGRLAALSIDGTSIRLAAPAWFRLYADHPANFDAWDIDHEALAVHDAIAAMPLKVVESGPVRAALEGTVSLPKGAGTLRLRYELDAGSAWLRLVADIEWTASRRLLKWHLPTAYRGRDARFGTPFGSILRPQQPGLPKEEAQWEVPASRWAAVLDDNRAGAAIVTEAKYGFSCRNGDLGLSLLRAPCNPDPEADRGAHRLVWAVGRHRGAATATEPTTAGAADTLFTPPLVVPGGHVPASPFVIEDAGSLVPAWVLPQDDGYVIRFHEVEGGSGTARIRFAEKPKEVEVVDLAGRREARLAIRNGMCQVPYTAYRMVSVQVHR